TGTKATLLRVRTKADRQPTALQEGAEFAVSATQRVGLREVVEEVRRAVQARLGEIEPSLPVITRARHQVALKRARDEIQMFLVAWDDDALPGIVAAVHVRSAVHALSELIGRIDTDAILGAVFERFCVGK
ncbi:MAG: hypothetical protein ABI877_16240, partial [Gemmatimonadaceae bacterium]